MSSIELSQALTGVESTPPNIISWARRYRGAYTYENQSIDMSLGLPTDFEISRLIGTGLWSINNLNIGGNLTVDGCDNININFGGTGSVSTVEHKSGNCRYYCSTNGISSGVYHYSISGGTAIISGQFIVSTPTQYAIVANRGITDINSPAVVYVSPSPNLGGNSTIADLQAGIYSTIIYQGSLVDDGVTWDPSGQGVIIDNTGVVSGPGNKRDQAIFRHVVTPSEASSNIVVFSGIGPFITENNAIISILGVNGSLTYPGPTVVSLQVGTSDVIATFSPSFLLVAGDIITAQEGTPA